MLLWIVLSTVAQLANPQSLIVLEEEKETVTFDPDLPVLQSGGELIRWLRENRMDNQAAIGSVNGFRYWLNDRGYPTYTMWIDIAAPSLVGLPPPLPANDDAALLSLAAAGNAAAATKLGGRSMQDDPLAALEWYDQAIVNGSIFAMVLTADSLTSLGDPALEGLRIGAVWQQAMDRIRAQDPPLESALAWHIATVIVGGYALMDLSHANRISELTDRLNTDQIRNACELSQDYVLETAKARRARGGAVFSTERPLFAVSIAEPEKSLPCEIPVMPLVDMSSCLTQAFVGPGQKLWQMYFCPSP